MLLWTLGRMYLQITVFAFSRYIATSWMAEHMSSGFSLLRNLYSVFYSAYANLHSLPQCTRVPFSTHHWWHLLYIDFLMIAILTMRWYFMALICKSIILWIITYFLLKCDRTSKKVCITNNILSKPNKMQNSQYHILMIK